MSRPTAPSPYRVTVHELGRRPGMSKSVTSAVPAPADLGTEVMGVPAGSDVDLDLRLDSVSDGIFVTGTARATLAGECSRCLDPLEEDVAVDLEELVLYEDRRAALVEEGDEESADAPVVEEDSVDLEPLLRDALVSALPFSPLCKPDCQGLCDVCGERWEDLPADHEHVLIDPRWGALTGLLEDPQDGSGAGGDSEPEGDSGADGDAGRPA